MFSATEFTRSLYPFVVENSDILRPTPATPYPDLPSHRNFQCKCPWTGLAAWRRNCSPPKPALVFRAERLSRMGCEVQLLFFGSKHQTSVSLAKLGKYLDAVCGLWDNHVDYLRCGQHRAGWQDNLESVRRPLLWPLCVELFWTATALGKDTNENPNSRDLHHCGNSGLHRLGRLIHKRKRPCLVIPHERCRNRHTHQRHAGGRSRTVWGARHPVVRQWRTCHGYRRRILSIQPFDHEPDGCGHRDRNWRHGLCRLHGADWRHPGQRTGLHRRRRAPFLLLRPRRIRQLRRIRQVPQAGNRGVRIEDRQYRCARLLRMPGAQDADAS